MAAASGTAPAASSATEAATNAAREEPVAATGRAAAATAAPDVLFSGARSAAAALDALPAGTPQETRAAGAPVTQRLTSEGTSLPGNDLMLYKSRWLADALVPGGENFDIGAGRTERPTERLAALGVRNIPFDPFNRDQTANAEAIQFIVDGERYPTVTVANVLNVIAEPESRSNVILQAAKALAPDGKAFFDVYTAPKEGETRAFQGTNLCGSFPRQSTRQSRVTPGSESTLSIPERHGR